MVPSPSTPLQADIATVPINTPFEPLIQRIMHEATVVGDRILKIDHFLNHRIDPSFMGALGQSMAERIHAFQPDLILTAEASGIAPALATAMVLDLPLVFAKKYTPVVEAPALARVISSPTKGGETMIVVSGRYLSAGMRVAIIDDFLANGRTAMALIDIVAEAGAKAVVAGFVVEKLFQQGRAELVARDIPVATLAQVERLEAGRVIMAQA